MRGFLKTNRNDQILENALDQPKANAQSIRILGRIMAPGGHSSDELHLALAPDADVPPYSIDVFHSYKFNQIKSTEK
ncbi:MAG TPA: hypothetical protein VMW34_17380 [Anaerolineales bacterium]|nr:hypothetical protein [Anaerolineales bacterium]